MKKRIIAIFIAVAISLNIFLFRAKAEMSAVATTVVLSLIGALLGRAANDCADSLANSVANGGDNFQYLTPAKELALTEANRLNVANSDILEIDWSLNGHYFFKPKEGLSSELNDMATYVCNELNNSPTINIDELLNTVDPLPDSNSQRVNKTSYEAIKTAATNSYWSYLNEKANGGLVDALGYDPRYSFSFTGPMPSVYVPSFEEVSNMITLQDYQLMRSFTIGVNTGRYPQSYDDAVAMGANNVSQIGGNFLPYYKCNAYGYGVFVVYNGDIFYKPDGVYSLHECNVLLNDVNTNAQFYFNKDGVPLSSYTTNMNGLNGGYYFVNSPNAADKPTVEVTADDFTTTVGGDALELPRSQAENVVGASLGLDFINDDSIIEVDSQGNITKVDGIPIERLQALLEDVAANTDNIKDYDTYLQAIKNLLNTLNLTEAQSKGILQNIKSDTGSIAQALAVSKTLELDKAETDSFDFSAYILEHTGLAEANIIANNMELLGQAKQLFNNLFLGLQDNGTRVPPNFKFYADMNGDGFVERYCWLDLSFMEYTLDNSTLDDKGRFVHPVTVREFFQSVLILIFYSVFTVKVLRKLPSLFGGAESCSDDINTINNPPVRH